MLDVSEWPLRAAKILLDDRELIEVSQGFAQHVNELPEQLLGRGLDEFLAPASRLYFLSALDPKLRQGQACEQQTLYLKTSLGNLPFLVSAYLQAAAVVMVFMPADQHLVLQQQLIQERDYTESINRDLSRQQQALIDQRNRQKAILEKLETTNHELLQTEKLAAVGQLAAGVAHEINNPLGYIQSNLNSLSHYVEGLIAVLDQAQDVQIKQRLQAENFEFIKTDLFDLLKESQQGVEHITQITSALTQFTRSPGKAQRCELHEQINTTLRVIHNELKSKAQIQRDYVPGPLQVSFDPAQLNQIIMNVLLNAGQAIERFGNIIISTVVEEHYAKLTIRDDGAGMDEETLRRATEPFFTTKPEGEGTGLGLSLVYNMIRRHSGKLQIDSQPGRGTAVTLWLPLVMDYEPVQG